MSPGSLKYSLYLLFALLTFAIGIFSIQRLLVKADLPFEYRSSRHESLIENDFGEFRKGDIITAVNNIAAESTFEIELIVDGSLPGDAIPVTVISPDSNKGTIPVTLVHYYKDYNFIIVTSIAGFAFWILGVFVFISKPNDKSAVLLSFTLIAFSVAILSTSGHFDRNDDWIGYAVRLSHTLSYVIGSIFFIMFILNFPVPSNRNRGLLTYLLYILTISFCVFAYYVNYFALHKMNTEWIEMHKHVWRLCEVILLTSLVAGVVLLLVKYIRLKNPDDRRKVEWIFWGLSIGAGPFILFWLIPNAFGFENVISEEIILAFLIVIPVSFAIAVVKYHILDIELLIKKSIIYFSLIALLLFLYYELILMFSNYFAKYTGYESTNFNIIAAILIALLLNPLRLKITKIVDKVFYRERYAFDKSIQKISSLTKECRTYEELGNMLLKEINNLIPVKSIAIVSRTLSGDRLRILAQNNFDMLQKNIGAFRLRNLITNVDLPFAVAQKVEQNFRFNNMLESVLRRWQIALAIPLAFDSGEAAGAILLGDKLSGIRYSLADYELLNTIASFAALAVKRMDLQEKLLAEEVELEKAKEISELKSYFVASVSHDLKTPLSAIKIFSELLQNENVTREKSKKYLAIIEGETERLKRMIDNVLDFSKIEKGLKQYSFKKIDLNKSADEVMKRMNYELSMQKFKIDKCMDSHPLFINADTNAVNSVLENLISNSIKYSGKNKYLKISTKLKDSNAEITIEDSGKGIPDKNLEHIFDPFYRELSAENSEIKGAGLGLAIVRNIVMAHNGEIEVHSKEGSGTSFTITFPNYTNGNQNITN